jgi:LacI family transcriptional regulator
MVARKPTLKMIASNAGVHVSTVSRALDPAKRHLIADPVIKAVEAAAQALGYRRDIGAAALRTGRTKLVGVILPDIANPVFGPILSGVEEALNQEGYSALVANAGRSAGRALEAAESLIARRVEGLVVATAELDDAVVALCLAERVPAVLVNRTEATTRTPAVVSDDREGMRLAIRHLVELGHTRIGHIAGPQNVSTGVWRLDGFLAAMAAERLSPEAVVTATDYTREAGRRAAKALLASHDVTAIAAANDLLALGAYAALAEAGLGCPRHVSIVGFNDMPLIDLVTPPLTSIRINPEAMGAAAGKRLLMAIADPQARAELQLLPPMLTLRASTARPQNEPRISV